MPVTEYLRHHVGREGVYTTNTYAVQTTRHLIGTLIELTSGVEHRHDDFERTLVHLLMLVNGNTTAIVLNGNGVILVNRYFNMCTISGHRLVDRVIDGFVDQMVESFFTNITNVHGRTLAHSL